MLEADPDERVWAFHGTTIEIAGRIVAEQRMLPSDNGFDWLGNGIYFFERNPVRALEWARQRHGDAHAAVVRARIRLGICLDLHDGRHQAFVGVVEEAFKADRLARGEPLPANRQKRRPFDHSVYDFLCANVEPAIETIHGPYPEGEVLYPEARLLRQSHIHLCVREATCILTVETYERDKIVAAQNGTL